MNKDISHATSRWIGSVPILAIALALMGGAGGSTASAAVAPSVTDVSSTLSDGNSVTITGAGFGATGPNIVLFDDFEGGSVGQTIKTGAGSAAIGQWWSVDSGNPKYASDTPHSGGKVFKSTQVPAGGRDAPGNAVQTKLPNATEIFLSWWQYVPADRPFPGELGYGTVTQGSLNWKIMWLLQDMSTTNHDQDLLMVANPRYFYITGNDAKWATPDFFTVSDMAKGTWIHFKWYEKGGTASDGVERLSKLTSTGLVNLVNATNITNMSAGQYRGYLSVNAYQRKHEDGVQPVQLFDDVYVATGAGAQARVEIGNAATYTACTNLTLATTTAWSDTQITATFRTGSFKTGDTAYLYVIDGKGNVSNAKQVKIQNGQAVPAPANLRLTY